jgi:hypothetical protein
MDMQSRKGRGLIAAIATLVLSGTAAAVVFAAPEWLINRTPINEPGVLLQGESGSKIVFRVPEQFEVVCEKLEELSGPSLTPSHLSNELGLAWLRLRNMRAKECNTVKNLKKVEAEKCEVEGGEVNFSPLESQVVWKESTGEERLIYIFAAENGGVVENTNGLWATIKVNNKGAEKCPAPLMGDHPLRGQMLAKLNTPTSEQTIKIFESAEATKCSQKKTYFSGEPRKAGTSEGLTIGGENNAEFCSVLEFGPVSGQKFSVH